MKIKVIGKAHMQGVSKRTGAPYDSFRCITTALPAAWRALQR